jgi:hypothetical protein
MFRDTSRDDERKKKLRKILFALAESGPVDFDTLCDKVVVDFPEPLAKA